MRRAVPARTAAATILAVLVVGCGIGEQAYRAAAPPEQASVTAGTPQPQPSTSSTASGFLTAEQIGYNLSMQVNPMTIVPSPVSLPAVTFEYNSARLTSQAERQLDELATALEFPSFQGLPFTLAGHTDARGSASYNQRLSERRAAAVRHYLESLHGFADTRVDTIGYGERHPLPSLSPTAAGQRRVEVTLQRPRG